jgi:hypothetical protein
VGDFINVGAKIAKKNENLVYISLQMLSDEFLGVIGVYLFTKVEGFNK